MNAMSKFVTIWFLLSTAIVNAIEIPFHWQWRKMEDNFWQRPILRQMKISNDDRVAIVDAVAASLKLDRESSSDVSETDLYDVASNESYEWADLDGDGAQNLLLKLLALIGAARSVTAHCKFFVDMVTNSN